MTCMAWMMKGAASLGGSDSDGHTVPLSPLEPVKVAVACIHGAVSQSSCQVVTR